MLTAAPELEAKALFEWLCEQRLGRYQEGRLRTFQRRVSRWRALHQDQIAMLEQVHYMAPQAARADNRFVHAICQKVDGTRASPEGANRSIGA